MKKDLLLIVALVFPIVFTACGNKEEASFVDLGLSVKWATCNLGANAPEEAGKYFAWGEVYPKSEYTEENSLTLRLGKDELIAKGIIDKHGVLTPKHDVATVTLGEEWHIPTQAEYQELIDNCTWKWQGRGNEEFNGVPGYKITSKVEGFTDNFIFLPAVGYHLGDIVQLEGSQSTDSVYIEGPRGDYWTSTISEHENRAYYLGLNVVNYELIGYTRQYGQSIRPVRK